MSYFLEDDELYDLNLDVHSGKLDIGKLKVPQIFNISPDLVEQNLYDEIKIHKIEKYKLL